MTMEDDDFLPGIEEYLEQSYELKSVTSQNLEEMILTICSKTGIKQEIIKVIVEYFFNELRNKMLAGYLIKLADFGKFFISSPKTTNAKRKVEIKFKPSKSLLKRINDKRS